MVTGVQTCLSDLGGVVVLGSAVVSGWLVKRIMDRADLVSVIKTRE